MKLNYYISDNNPHKNGAVARVVSVRTLNEDDLIDKMGRYNTTLTSTDLKAMLKLLPIALADLVQEGYRVRTGFGNFGAAIRGLFKNSNDRFTPGRHSVAITCSPCASLQKRIRTDLQCRKINKPDPGPQMHNLRDLKSNSTMKFITPGGAAIIDGLNLKFDPLDPEQGVFLLGANKKFRADTYLEVRPKRIILEWPRVPKNECFGLTICSKRTGKLLSTIIEKIDSKSGFVVIGNRK